MPRAAFYNITVVNGKPLHVISESLRGTKMDLCHKCSLGLKKSPQQASETAEEEDFVESADEDSDEPGSGSKVDRFDDLYVSNAPANSIAAGADYGRLRYLSDLGIPTDVSTLEQLVLATARCHHVIFKVVAYDNQTNRKRLHGHSIVCPQRPEPLSKEFGEEALAAAYGSVTILFVGPSGQQEKLERAALKIEDLRLRPEVIYNFLTIKHVLHGEKPPPSIDEVVKLIEDHGLEAHIKENARRQLDTAVERATEASDVANVRSAAQSPRLAQENDAEAESAVTTGEEVAPNLSPVGLFEDHCQDMSAVISGITELYEQQERVEGEETDQRRQARDAKSTRHGGTIKMTRSGPLDDYENASKAIYAAFWPLFPLKRGFAPGKPVPEKKWRHLFLYFDNRFAHQMTLMFHVANVIMRHNVNRAVGVKIKSNPEAFAKFRESFHDPDFRKTLQAAGKDYRGPAARAVLTHVTDFINLCARQVPWSSGERAAEMTNLIARHRYAGPASIFYSVAPDGVHNVNTLRWAAPFTSHDSFPATVSSEYLAALQGLDPEQRTVLDSDGNVLHRLDEGTLQMVAASNPVAEALMFDILVSNMRQNLLRNTNNRKVNASVATERPKGVLGVNVINHDVTECNKRGCFHKHGHAHGGATPALVADVAAIPELREQLLSALDTQVQGTLPLEYHAMTILLQHFRVGLRRDAAYPIPLPPARPDKKASDDLKKVYQEELEEWRQRFFHHAMMVVANRHVHQHCGTCMQGKRGKKGCRMCAPWGHDLDSTRLVELRDQQKEKERYRSEESQSASETSEYPISCRLCHAGGALDEMSDMSHAERQVNLAREAERRDLHYTLHAPSEHKGDGPDKRMLALDIKRPMLPEPRNVSEDDESYDTSVLARFVRDNRDRRPSLGSVLDDLRQMIAADQPLGRLLQQPELALLSKKIEAITAEPMEVEDVTEEEQGNRQEDLKKREEAAGKVLGALKGLTGCRQGKIADYNLIFAGCTRGNAMILSLGAGAGSKATAMYQIKYMSKNSVEISAATSVLLDAEAHVREYKSRASDSGTAERTARYFAQRVINRASMELEAAQAAAIVLGMKSSGGSDDNKFYSGWEVRKLAKIVAGGNFEDIDFSSDSNPGDSDSDDEFANGQAQEEEVETETEDVEQETSDDHECTTVSQSSDAVEESEQSQASLGQVRAGASRSKTSTDLTDECEQPQGEKTGYAAVYQDHKGDKVAVSQAHHYAYRDEQLSSLNSYVFAQAFNIRKMKKEDRIWYEKELQGQNQGGDIRAGRPCDRFRLLEPHPLAKSHVLVRRAKLATPTWAGPPPPKQTPTPAEDDSDAAKRKRAIFAEFYVANFVPWSMADAKRNDGLDLSYERWLDHVAELERLACLHSERETCPGAEPSEEEIEEFEERRDWRMIAAGALFTLENLMDGLGFDQDTNRVLGKHRARASDIWNDSNRPPGQANGDDEEMKAAAQQIDKIQQQAQRLRSAKDMVTRQKEAAAVSEWGKRLTAALPSQLPSSARATEKLKDSWSTAAAPAHRSLQPAPSNIKAVQDALKRPILPPQPSETQATTSDRRVRGTESGSSGDPFAPVTYEEYLAAAEAHKSSGAPQSEAPLNPEQRDGGRDFLRVAQMRATGRRQSLSLEGIDKLAHDAGLSQVTLVMGAGGTGKSAMIHKLKSEFEKRQLGVLLVTAFTGVAAAPFAGPTLLSLLKMGCHGKFEKRVRSANQQQREKRREKFETESGYSIDKIGGIVIDEVSFIELGLFGHLDANLQNLVSCEPTDVTCGGIPILLCGDNHQKPPPGGVPWYKKLVDYALKPLESPIAQGPMSAEGRGLKLLQSAKRIDLWRIMRAKEDEKFVEIMQKMRRTDEDRPIPADFLKNLKPVTQSDINKHSGWRFAPVGCLSHIERDTINHVQLYEFARTFDLPVIRWRHHLVDDAFEDDEVREELFKHEKNLWGYFVEGAPVHMLETIKSVRKLVNGSPALLDSVVAANEDDQRTLDNRLAGGYSEVTLTQPPTAVNLIVGGTPETPRLWHGRPLDDLSGLIGDPYYECQEQMVSLPVSSVVEKAECNSIYAAQHGIAQKLNVKQHQYGFAFALTDFKLQGATLERLILSVGLRKKMPWMKMSSFYVLVSRVRKLDGLRLLEKDRRGLDAISKLQHDPHLHAWENGYTNGKWDEAKAVRAFEEIRAKRDMEKTANKKKANKPAAPGQQTVAPARAAQATLNATEDASAGNFGATGMTTATHGQGLRGLKNLGATCYMNSVFQCLSHCDTLRSYFLSNQLKEHIRRDSATNGQIATSFSALMKQLWSKRTNAAFLPREMANVVRRYSGGEFGGTEQQDAHEFHMKLITWLLQDTSDGLPEMLNENWVDSDR